MTRHSRSRTCPGGARGWWRVHRWEVVLVDHPAVLAHTDLFEAVGDIFGTNLFVVGLGGRIPHLGIFPLGSIHFNSIVAVSIWDTGRLVWRINGMQRLLAVLGAHPDRRGCRQRDIGPGEEITQSSDTLTDEIQVLVHIEDTHPLGEESERMHLEEVTQGDRLASEAPIHTIS
ncbi:hypothetical protein AAE478_008681 [Parahypoxylon ruwenzoriense]